MERTRRFTWAALSLAGAAALQAGCGGGSEFGDSDLFDQAGGLESPDANDLGFVDDDGSGSGRSIPGALEAGAVTEFTEPGHAVVTVDGRTIDHTPDGSGGGFRCDLADEYVNVEVRSEIGTMVVTATRVDDGWIGRFTADSDEGERTTGSSTRPSSSTASSASTSTRTH